VIEDDVTELKKCLSNCSWKRTLVNNFYDKTKLKRKAERTRNECQPDMNAESVREDDDVLDARDVHASHEAWRFEEHRKQE